MSAIAIVTGSPSSGCTTQTPSPHARQVPSTSVSAGPPLGPVSTPGAPADDAAHHDAGADHVRTQVRGGGRRRDAALEGWASDESGTTGY